MMPVIATDHFHPDEQVWLLEEIQRDVPMHGSHRFQRIVLRRGNRLMEYLEDLGLWESFPVNHAFQFAAFLEYSVGEAREIAEYSRMVNMDPQWVEPRTAKQLWSTYADNLEEAQLKHARRTTIGPLVRVQRD